MQNSTCTVLNECYFNTSGGGDVKGKVFANNTCALLKYFCMLKIHN